MPEHISKSLGKILLLTIVLTYFSVELHETGHWMMLQLLGRGLTMGFGGIVQRWDLPPLHPVHWQKITYPDLAPGSCDCKYCPEPTASGQLCFWRDSLCR